MKAVSVDHARDVPDREPPQDFSAEQAVLGSILIETEAVNLAFGIVKPDDFYRTYHKIIASAMYTVWERKEPVDLVTVSAELRRLGKLDEVGGGEYITALIGEVPTAAHVVRYANIVAEKALLRRMIIESSAIQADAYANPENVGATLATAADRLKQLQERVAGATVFKPAQSYERDIDEAWDDWRKPRPKVTAARLGIGEADRYMGGLGAHSLCVIKAGKKNGKSQLLRQATIESARAMMAEGQGRHVMFFGLEERWRLWRSFAWSYLSGIDSKEFTLAGWMLRYLEDQPDAKKQVRRAQRELQSLPLLVSFGERDWGAIKSAINVNANRYNIGLIVIDYFQKLRGGVENPYGSEEYGYRKRAESIVELGNDLNIPILTGSQVTWSRDLKMNISKGASALEEEAVTVLEWRRDADAKSHAMHDSGSLTCVTARLGTGFSKPINVITNMKCGRYWDTEQYQKMRTEEERAAALERGEEPPERPDGAGNEDPFE